MSFHQTSVETYSEQKRRSWFLRVFKSQQVIFSLVRWIVPLKCSMKGYRPLTLDEIMWSTSFTRQTFQEEFGVYDVLVDDKDEN